MMSPSATPGSEKPALVVLVLFCGVTVNYITRNSLGIIAPELKATLGITTEQYSWIVGAFQLAYTIFQPAVRLAYRRHWPEAWLYDLRHPGRWPVSPTPGPVAGCTAMLRFFMGGAEAAALRPTPKPSANGSKSERPIAAGWAGVGFSIGTMLAPPIIFAHASFGWQGAFMFTGALALLWVVWWAFYQTPSTPISAKRAGVHQTDNEAADQNSPSLPRSKPSRKINVSTGSPFRLYGRARLGGAEFLGAAVPAKSTAWKQTLKQIAMFAAAVSPPISAAWSATTSPACMFAGSAVRE